MNQQKPSFGTSALIAGIALGITSALPVLNLVNCACCALVLGGGFLAVYLYLREYPSGYPPVTYGEAAVLGLLTGVIGGLVWTVVDIPLTFLKYQIGWEMTDLAEIESALSNPSIPPAMRELVTTLITGGGLTLGMIFFGLVVNLLVCVVFAMIGAIIGLAILQKSPPPVYMTPAGTPPAAGSSGPAGPTPPPSSGQEQPPPIG